MIICKVNRKSVLKVVFIINLVKNGRKQGRRWYLHNQTVFIPSRKKRKTFFFQTFKKNSNHWLKKIVKIWKNSIISEQK